MKDDIQFDSEGNMLWNKVEPPFQWEAYDLHIIAERFGEEGPEYIVYGDIENSVVLSNATIYNWYHMQSVEFSVREEGWVHRWYREGK